MNKMNKMNKKKSQLLKEISRLSNLRLNDVVAMSFKKSSNI